MIKIKRQNKGRTPTKWGISLKGMAPRYQKILKENKIFRLYSDDTRFILSIFKIEDQNIKVSHKKRPFINPDTKEVSPYSNVVNDYKIINWECAYCKTPIKSKIDNYKAHNFTCKKCFDYYIKDTKVYNSRIVEASLEFTTHCRRLMLDNQKKFVKYIKRNEK